MNKWQAQDVYWNSFGIPAYEESTVPETAVMPYIRYQPVNGYLNGIANASASMYYKGTSWQPIMEQEVAMEKKADQQIAIDGGYIKFRKPISNYAQPLDSEDEKVRRIFFTVEVEILAE